MSDLKALGQSAKNNDHGYNYSSPDINLLETFDSPLTIIGARCEIHIEVPEFTSLCPITGQPDFAKILIKYTPNKVCVESKSLKLYMASYRNHGDFHEACVARMAEHLIEVLDPIHLYVKGEFTPRGGIPFHPIVRFSK